MVKILTGTGSSGERSVGLTSSAGGTVQKGSYTIKSGDTDGVARYSVSGITDSKGNRITKIGAVTHEGRVVYIDTEKPTATTTITPITDAAKKIVTYTITDNNIPTKISYKLTSATCASKSNYDSATEDEKEVPVIGNVARVSVSGTANNGKVVCAKITDLAGLTAYIASNALSGIVARTVQISEFSYKPTDSAYYEFIEIVNKSGSTITAFADDYQVIDGEGKRSITYVSGGASLADNAVAIIVRDPAKFKQKYPGYVGTLFKSSFSLGR